MDPSVYTAAGRQYNSAEPGHAEYLRLLAETAWDSNSWDVVPAGQSVLPGDEVLDYFADGRNGGHWRPATTWEVQMTDPKYRGATTEEQEAVTPLLPTSRLVRRKKPEQKKEATDNKSPAKAAILPDALGQVEKSKEFQRIQEILLAVEQSQTANTGKGNQMSTQATTNNTAATAEFSLTDGMLMQIFVGAGTTFGIDQLTETVTAWLALKLAEADQPEAARMLVTAEAKSGLKLVAPAAALGIATLFLDTKNEALKSAVTTAIPALKMATAAGLADVGKQVASKFLSNKSAADRLTEALAQADERKALAAEEAAERANEAAERAARELAERANARRPLRERKTAAVAAAGEAATTATRPVRSLTT